MEMKIFVHQEFLVEKMKEIVILMMSVKATIFVDQTTAGLHSVLTLKLIVVVVLKLWVPIIQIHTQKIQKRLG